MKKKIAFFCIPAQGHTNPMLPIAAELVRRGNAVRFYSFDEFEKKIRDTGAEFLSCDSFLPKLTEQEEAGLKNVSATEMTVQDIRITLSMNDFLDKEFKTFQPDVVYTDSVCFWGKLNAWKHHVPMAVSTSTFAFNQMSSQYMKNSPKEMTDMIFGLPKVSLAVLSKADVFLTHCGMNSVSESLYMATPMVFFPQTAEQYAVARRASEIGAGIRLKDDSVQGILWALKEILYNKAYGTAAKECSEDFRACSGTAGAAEFIENVPHRWEGVDIIGELNKSAAKFRILYWVTGIVIINLVGFLVGWKYVWPVGIAAGVLSMPFHKIMQKRIYGRLTNGGRGRI